jgi:hypothetical protein
VSGSVALNIVTGSDWAVQISWKDSDGNPILFNDPVMDIRQELSPTGNKIASLDGSGNLDGSILIPEIGTLLLQIPASRTATLQTGQGFWDLFVTINNARIRLVFGTVSIIPHVTAMVNS